MTEHRVYILTNAINGPIFIGATSDLLYRLIQHRSGRPANPVFVIDRLVYTEAHACSYKAQARVKALKSASREWLDALITSKNPAWQELMPMSIEEDLAA